VSWHVCIEDRCPELTEHRSKRCPRHQIKRSPSSAATSAPGWKRIRLEVLERDRYVCQLCGASATCVDHVEGVAYGGSGDRSNLQAACQPCNDRKKGQAPLGREYR